MQQLFVLGKKNAAFMVATTTIRPVFWVRSCQYTRKSGLTPGWIVALLPRVHVVVAQAILTFEVGQRLMHPKFE